MRYILIFVVLLFVAESCKTKDKDVPGKGGNATVTVYPQHHSIAKRLVDFKVYVKYNTLDAPTSGIYDDSLSCTNHDSLVSCSFQGLKNGNYYFYGKGRDTSLTVQTVKGGLPYTITVQGSQSFNLPVSE